MKKNHFKKILISALVLCFGTFGFVLSAVAAPGDISTVAGGGVGDGDLAVSARFFSPYDVFVDGSGNIYIAEGGNRRIRKVDTSGIISTVAGDGTYGFSGDGGPATSASLAAPYDVSVDGSGNIFIAECRNNRIRKVDTSGIISTVAGDGTRGFSGDGGPATSASVSEPVGVFVDGLSNIYIAEEDSHRIRKVDTSGIISTVAGNGTRGFSGDGGPAISASLSSPQSVFVDGLGNIYIVDAGNYRIRKVDTSGIISTVPLDGLVGFSGDGGPATDASLNFPSDVSVDGSGNIYIADMNNGRIRKVDTSGIISTVAGNGTFGFSGDGGPATDASLNFPSDVSVDGSGNIYIADMNNGRIRKVDTSGIISTVAGNGTFGFSGDGGPATDAKLFTPRGVYVDGSGVIYIVDWFNHLIRKVDTSGIISTVAGNGSSGGFSGDGGPATSASLNRPYGVFVDGLGNIYIVDAGNHRIRKVEGILVGDFDGDTEVGLSDFVRFLDVFGATTDPANSVFDLDNNGEIGLSDFVIFLDNFGKTG